MHDPGNVYLIGFAFTFFVAALTMLAAKVSVEKRGENTPLTMNHIRYTASAGAALVAAGVAKVTLFADFYKEHSIYMPA